MRPATRDALLRAGLVLAFGVAAALFVLAFQRWESAGDLEAELARLEEELVAAEEFGPAQGAEPAEDELALRVRERVEARHVFAPPPAERFRSVRGVLGDRVLFEGGESAAVGEEYDGAEVLGVGAESVRFRKAGEEITVEVGGGPAGGGGGFPGGSPGGFGFGEFGAAGGPPPAVDGSEGSRSGKSPRKRGRGRRSRGSGGT